MNANESAGIVKAVTDLTKTVSGKVREIDDKVQSVVSESKLAIQAVESAFNQKSDELTAYAIEGHKKAIEDASGGRNTVLVDDQGNSNVMVRIPRFTYEDVNAAILANTGIDLQLGTGTPTMFLTNGVPRSEVLIGKYLASTGVKGGCSVIGGVQPRTYVNYDTAKSLCENKGAGWHMMSIHEWAAIALWAYANETVPRGNTNYGRAHDNKLETVRRSDNEIPGDASGNGRTDTGKGPATWGHDHTEFGVQDLVGNVWEWLDQMKLDDGQIITTLDNDPDIDEARWQRHAAYFDSQSENTTGNVGSPILSNSVTNRNGPIDDDSHDYAYMSNRHFAATPKSEGYQALELLRRLLVESASTTNVTGALYVRNYGDRFPLRGGNWSAGSSAGVGALNLINARSYASSNFGFRPAFFA
ncbi:hypothetical protein BCT90_04245 [Vibrio lentus]|uniref:SUMF1/EgtB/PvdO family nonheme iron enzyme n=1 Tax=Vibrio lentus TaxID=136468 RepID=UPI000C82E2E0|nr:SUMF1/EgtB/PvdO family nonheme iron enzyme [Vibrio lentus]PMK93213.1 hypothetical protein BCT90_04245 [Vibrio lentus]